MLDEARVEESLGFAMVAATDPESSPLPPLIAAIGSWQLNPAATTVEWSATAMWGLLKVKGSLEAVSGYATFSIGGAVDGAFVIATHTLDTKNSLRDKHLRGKSFFDVDRYPTLVYAVTGVNAESAENLRVRGALMIKGRSRPTELQAKFRECSDTRMTLSASTEIDRSAWGIGGSELGVDPRNRIVVVAEFRRVGNCDPREAS